MATTSTASHRAPRRRDGIAEGSGPGGHDRVWLVVVGSLAAGWLAALLLAVAPFVPDEVPRVTGALLCGYALGWSLLAGLSTRFTDQPQRWAWAFAAFMG